MTEGKCGDSWELGNLSPYLDRIWYFFKVGFPLTVLIYLIAIVLVPMVWPP